MVARRSLPWRAISARSGGGRATCLRTPAGSGSTSAMGTLVNVEGRLVPPEQAFVPVLDRGFLYGDSVYEVVRTYAGRPFELDRHLERLDRSAARIGLTLPPRARIEGELARTLQTAGNPESYARIVVTR